MNQCAFFLTKAYIEVLLKQFFKKAWIQNKSSYPCTQDRKLITQTCLLLFLICFIIMKYFRHVESVANNTVNTQLNEITYLLFLITYLLFLSHKITQRLISTFKAQIETFVQREMNEAVRLYEAWSWTWVSCISRENCCWVKITNISTCWIQEAAKNLAISPGPQVGKSHFWEPKTSLHPIHIIWKIPNWKYRAGLELLKLLWKCFQNSALPLKKENLSLQSEITNHTSKWTTMRKNQQKHKWKMFHSKKQT